MSSQYLPPNSVDGKARERRRQLRAAQEYEREQRRLDAAYDRWRHHMTEYHDFPEDHEDFWQIWHDEETDCQWRAA